MKLLFLWCQYLSLFFQFHSSKNISLRKLLAVIRTEPYLTGFYPGEDLLASIVSLDLVLPNKQRSQQKFDLLAKRKSTKDINLWV